MRGNLHPFDPILVVAGLLVACGGEGSSFPSAAPTGVGAWNDANSDARDARADAVNDLHDSSVEPPPDSAADDAELASDAPSDVFETGPDVVDAGLDAAIDAADEHEPGCIEGAHEEGGVCGRTCVGGVWTDDACAPIAPPRQRIAVGDRHACLLTAGGGVRCWGSNVSGQLGVGDRSDSFVPRDVPGLESGVVEVAAANWSTCALTTDGKVKCWGNSVSLGSTGAPGGAYLSPVEVADLTGAVSIRSGRDSNCALTSDGQVYCWGQVYNVGIPGGPLDQPHATGIAGLPAVRAISLGDNRACALTLNGLVLCWTPQNLALVPGLSSGVRTVAAGRHSCVITETGTAKCWGLNDAGQLGAPAPDDETPVDVPGLSGLQSIAVGEGRSCAVGSSGEVTCWGRRNWGLVGDGLSAGASMESAKVQGLAAGVRGISLGRSNTCVELATGAFQCWGENTSGEHGTGVSSRLMSPVGVAGLSGGMQAVAAGERHTCGLTDSGGVKCWGNGSAYQLGSGSLSNSMQAVDVVGLTGVTDIAAGMNFGLALTASDDVVCWGRCPVLGNVQSPIDEPFPVGVVGLTSELTSGVRSLAAGETHACAVTADGSVKCWGSDLFGKLGDGPPPGTGNLVTVPFEEPQRSVAAGRDHTCALSESGGVTCWGYDEWGQLGNGSDGLPSTLPSPVSGLSSGVEAITAGAAHTCALLSDGAMKCWGANIEGALGIGTTAWVAVEAPVDVVGLASGVQAITASWRRTCALMVTGGVKCWGEDMLLGVDTSQPAGAPRDVIGLPSGVRAVSLGRAHLCALMDDGSIVCHGEDYEGQSSGMFPGYPHDVAQ
jgi:alpha-tubulin suppressor-like RCC1 family protein